MSRRPPNTIIDPDYLFRQQYEYVGIGQITADNYIESCAKDRGDVKGKPGAGFAERYKVKLCYYNSATTSENILVYAIRHTDLPSGQGACGINIPLTPNTFVNIHRNNTSKKYYITSVMTSPNCSYDPQSQEFQGCGPKSGFVAGLNKIQVPTTHIKEDKSGTGNETGAGAPCVFSLQDKLQDDDRKLSIAVPLACKTVNVGGINTEIKNLIKSLEKAKKDLFGPGSFIQNSEEGIFLESIDAGLLSQKYAYFLDEGTHYHNLTQDTTGFNGNFFIYSIEVPDSATEWSEVTLTVKEIQSAPNGFTGTYSTSEGQIVSVTDGLITDIS